MESLVLRLANSGDIEDILFLEETCFAIPWSKQSLTQDINENDRALYVVAEINEKIVGYAGLWVIFDEGHITNVAVNPSYRKKGIGDSLINKLIEEAEKRGVVAYTLEVRISNIPAQNLYSKHNFKNNGVRKSYYKDNGEDAIIMWRLTE